VTESIFENNFSLTNGGAINVMQTALLVQSTQLVVKSCIFRNNSAATQGGAIYTGRFTTIVNSTFAGNTAFYGGTIYMQSPTNPMMEITGCTFEDSEGCESSSGIYCGLGQVSIRDSLFRNLNLVSFSFLCFSLLLLSCCLLSSLF